MVCQTVERLSGEIILNDLALELEAVGAVSDHAHVRNPPLPINPATLIYLLLGAQSKAPRRVMYCHMVVGEYRCGCALSTCKDLVGMFGGCCAKQ